MRLGKTKGKKEAPTLETPTDRQIDTEIPNGLGNLDCDWWVVGGSVGTHLRVPNSRRTRSQGEPHTFVSFTSRSPVRSSAWVAEKNALTLPASGAGRAAAGTGTALVRLTGQVAARGKGSPAPCGTGTSWSSEHFPCRDTPPPRYCRRVRRSSFLPTLQPQTQKAHRTLKQASAEINKWITIPRPITSKFQKVPGKKKSWKKSEG